MVHFMRLRARYIRSKSYRFSLIPIHDEDYRNNMMIPNETKVKNDKSVKAMRDTSTYCIIDVEDVERY